MALKRAPSGPAAAQLLPSLREGVPDCCQIDERTPSDGLKYFVDISNERKRKAPTDAAGDGDGKRQRSQAGYEAAYL
eukprot:5941981-Pyramimonas_sp.AAC.1